MPLLKLALCINDDLNHSVRGAGGFGSTGVSAAAAVAPAAVVSSSNGAAETATKRARTDDDGKSQ
jgi:hypothetical protein